MCITKTLSLLVNGVLLASGAALFIAAIVINEVSLKFLTTQQVDLAWIVTVLTIAGAMAAAAAISGLVGACCCEIKYLLYLSFGLILAVFIMEAVFVINSSVATVDNFNNYIDKGAWNQMAQYENQSSTAREEWDNFQTYGECCGLNSYTDWSTVGLPVPNSCCKNKATCATSTTSNIYTTGCKAILKDKFIENINILRGTSYAMMFVHAGAGAFAIFMMVKAALCGCCCCC